MKTAQEFARALLQQIETTRGKPVPVPLRRAFLDCPRHQFIPEYLDPRTRQWRRVDLNEPGPHLSELYADRSLAIFQREGTPYLATISQPSLVLDMLERLDIQPGARIFEIGTGSGWNAALLSRLVGPEGVVLTSEILPELVTRSQQAFKRTGIERVRVLPGDGAAGYPTGAPYDRIIFTAAASDLSRPLFEQLVEGGLMLAVLKIPGGGDDLVLLRKQAGRLVSEYAAAVQFVPMLGAYYRPDWQEGRDLMAFLAEHGLSAEPVGRRPFVWGSRAAGSLMPQTEGLRSFLSLSEPGFRILQNVRFSAPLCFGLYDEESGSLVVAQPDALISYANRQAEDRLLGALGRWVELGMPTSVQLELNVYPKTDPVPDNPGGWKQERADFWFCWHVPA